MVALLTLHLLHALFPGPGRAGKASDGTAFKAIGARLRLVVVLARAAETSGGRGQEWHTR